MFILASLGVPAGTENGVRSTFETCTISCMPPIFGSRKSVWVRPTVVSFIVLFADCEPATPNPIGVLPLASTATFFVALHHAVVAVQQRFLRGYLGAVDAGPRLDQRQLLVGVDDEVGNVRVGDVAAAAAREVVRGDEADVVDRLETTLTEPPVPVAVAVALVAGLNVL